GRTVVGRAPARRPDARCGCGWTFRALWRGGGVDIRDHRQPGGGRRRAAHPAGERDPADPLRGDPPARGLPRQHRRVQRRRRLARRHGRRAPRRAHPLRPGGVAGLRAPAPARRAPLVHPGQPEGHRPRRRAVRHPRRQDRPARALRAAGPQHRVGARRPVRHADPALLGVHGDRQRHLERRLHRARVDPRGELGPGRAVPGADQLRRHRPAPRRARRADRAPPPDADRGPAPRSAV
ncbi:MAG: DedA protein, partial [uncultured Pseudonocardia sp.]